MGKTNQLGVLADVFTSDASNNVGIGGSPSGSYKLEVTGTAKVSSTLLVSGAATFSSTISATKVILSLGAEQAELTSAFNNDFKLTNSGAFRIINNANTIALLTVTNAGAATFSSSVTAAGEYVNTSGNASRIFFSGTATTGYQYVNIKNTSASLLYGIEGNTTGNLATGDIAYSSGIYTGTATPLHFGANQVVGMTLTAANDVLINKTSATNTGKFELNYSRNDNVGMSLNDTTASAGCGHIYFQRGGTNVGSITSPNNSSTAFNTSSDYRLKEDLQEINGLEKALAIKVYNFKWKNEEDRSDGVLAHELAEILPYAVNGEKDAIDEKDNIIPQGVDYSKLIPVLVKAIQELSAQNQDLKSRLDKAGL